MSKKKTPKGIKKKKQSQPTAVAPLESRASESLTVFWAVTVLMVLMMNLVCIGVHYYVAANPDAEKMQLLKGLLLFTGSLVGGVSLIVLPILYRVRKVPPPPGLAVFGACVAAAPILAAIAFATG
ncbi:MAG: hypothetical protein AAGD11_01515 [Planctomycetota bacterium]